MTTTNSTRGRPADLAKRDAILDAARSQFLTKGFERTTMESVAATARVSKVTVFHHFGDKVSLLEATVERESDNLQRLAFPAGNGERDPVAQLAQCGEVLLHVLVSPEILAFDRLLGFEPHKGSELVRRFFAAGPQRARAILAELILKAADIGLVHLDNPDQAADDLLALWLGATWREEIALGLCRSPGEKHIRARVRRGLQAFLRMYASSDSS